METTESDNHMNDGPRLHALVDNDCRNGHHSWSGGGTGPCTMCGAKNEPTPPAACACAPYPHGEWNPACPAHPPATEPWRCTCLDGPTCERHKPAVHMPPPERATVRTAHRTLARVSAEDFHRAMRLLRADREDEGLVLVTLHIEGGRITATYAEVHTVGVAEYEEAP